MTDTPIRRLPPFPAWLARLHAALPAWPFSLGLSAALNRSVWPVLRHQQWQTLQGRRFCVKVRDLGLAAYFTLGPQGFSPLVDECAHVTFTASAEDYLRLALRLEDPDTLFFNRRLLIEGDTALGLAVKNWLDGVELDEVVQAMPTALGWGMLALRRFLSQESMGA